MSFGGIVVASELAEEAIRVRPGFGMGVLNYRHDCLWLVVVLVARYEVRTLNFHSSVVFQCGKMS